MKLKEGMTIRTFPETDVNAYKLMIEREGFRAIVHSDYLEVGENIKKLVINRETFPRELRTARKAAKLTRQELADKIGVSKDSVYAWEIGKRLPGPFNLDLLKGVLNFDSSGVIRKDNIL